MAAKEKSFGEVMATMLPKLMRSVTQQDGQDLVKSNITIPQMFMLEYLRESGPRPMSAVAKMLGLTTSASTSVVDKMVKSGLLQRERRPEDRRVVMVGLADKGEKLANDIKDSKVRLLDRIYSVLTASEQTQYLKLLKKVYDSLED